MFLISSWQWERVKQYADLMTKVTGWDMQESPSVNILPMTKLLSFVPLSWDMDCLLTLWPLLIPCFPGNGCCTFWFSDLYHCQKKFLVKQPLYTWRKIIKTPLLHQSLGPHVFLSFSLSFFLSLSLPLSFPLSPANYLELGNLPSSFSCLGSQDPMERVPWDFVSSAGPVLAFCWFSA